MASCGEEIGELPVLETLCLTLPDSNAVDDTDDNKQDTLSVEDEASQSQTSEDLCSCIFCTYTVNISQDKDSLLRHLIISHKLVVADVKLIANLKKYILYWKKRMKGHPITDFCSTIVLNSKESDIGKRENYYLLSDVFPEDKYLRQYLQKKRLETALEVQQKERTDQTFSRDCLFCREHFLGNRSELFNHMAFDHGFNVGQPDNLVFVSEFLNKLQQKLDNLQCLYCEKTFRDRPTLKEHMRKKQHKRIKSNNTLYDKYYIINYLEIGKNWENFESSEEFSTDFDCEENWDGWHDESGSTAVCLFCDFSSADADILLQHMKDSHGLDLNLLKKEHNLDFYQQVKLINYIRRQVHLLKCISCDKQFESKDVLMLHLHSSGHSQQIPKSNMWMQPQYYFPTYENDNLLCQLMDNTIPEANNSGMMSEDCDFKPENFLPECILNEILSID
ncbi:finger 277 [Octopus vulgaris]|uniref:Finger 277 n=1 Tax=Octopus vulgaris TaxID=6645 RepID=A0AA36AY24_OCTVU|nr:finger 277 [Octopus vulgaris]